MNPKLLKTGERLCLTSTDIRPQNVIPMEQATPKAGRAKQQAAYPLRFRSKAQKKRLEDAAKREHKTLRDFLLDLGENAAAVTSEQRAS